MEKSHTSAPPHSSFDHSTYLGHAIVPGSITPGTLLYHGTSQASPPPPGPEWLSFDPEHSAMFGNKLITYVVGSKALRIIYFDGSR